MEKNIANRLLGITRLQYGGKNPWQEGRWAHSDPYEITIPKNIESVVDDLNFFRALMVHNKETFDNWGKMEDTEIIIPTLKKYKIRTAFSGSEAVRRTYQDTVSAYDENDLVSALNNCDPCYDEGEEIDVEWFDREGDWEVEDVQQITEEDINRIVKKILK